MDSKLHGWSALVTGGGSGIGLAGARALLRAGCTVTISGRSEERLKKGVESLAADVPNLDPKPGVFAVAADASNEEDVKRAIKAAYDNGGGKLNILVMSAGGGDPERSEVLALLANTSMGSFERTLSLNLTSSFLGIKHAAPYMRASLPPREGPRPQTASIVCLSSIAGSKRHEHLGPYSIAKAGIDQLVRNAAGELGKYGIRVNSVQPGLVPTEAAAGLAGDPDTVNDYLDNMPLGRVGDVDDCGDLIRFLAGPESSWITGATIPVDGGHHMERGPRLHVLASKFMGPQVTEMPEMPK
ncbi:hypothetical protein DFJ74DRAFT_100870 [Hyaloraphidium curvatum]|nr:hypothetical protein DFJ74DRAFT_100870 [Hyaloraphidium curvatum]